MDKNILHKIEIQLPCTLLGLQIKRKNKHKHEEIEEWQKRKIQEPFYKRMVENHESLKIYSFSFVCYIFEIATRSRQSYKWLRAEGISLDLLIFLIHSWKTKREAMIPEEKSEAAVIKVGDFNIHSINRTWHK